MEVNKFTEKLNKIEGRIYVAEEEVHPENGVYEADLWHDNVNTDTLSVYTGPMLTGKRVETFALSTPALTPWKRSIRIYSTEPVLYISYETEGDTVEAEDINRVQDAVTVTQQALNQESGRAGEAEEELGRQIEREGERARQREDVLEEALSYETSRAQNRENTLESSIKSETARAEYAEAQMQEQKADKEYVDTRLGGKVDKETGKGLSQNDLTDALLTKLNGIAPGAQVNTITGIKGDKESTYRTGNVNLSPDHIGALAVTGGNLSGTLHTRDIFVGEFTDNNGIFMPTQNKSSISVNGTTRLFGEVKVGGSISADGQTMTVGETCLGGRLNMGGNDIDNVKSLHVFGETTTNGRLTLGSTLDLNGVNVENGAAATFNGTIRSNGDLVTHSIKPYADDTYNLGNTSKRYKNGYISNIKCSELEIASTEDKMIITGDYIKGDTNQCIEGFYSINANHISASNIIEDGESLSEKYTDTETFSRLDTRVGALEGRDFASTNWYKYLSWVDRAYPAADAMYNNHVVKRTNSGVKITCDEGIYASIQGTEYKYYVNRMGMCTFEVNISSLSVGIDEDADERGGVLLQFDTPAGISEGGSTLSFHPVRVRILDRNDRNIYLYSTIRLSVLGKVEIFLQFDASHYDTSAAYDITGGLSYALQPVYT